MNKYILIALGLLVMALSSMAAADVSGTLAANTTQDFTVNLADGTYTADFGAPSKGWTANITYICHA